MLDFAIVEVTNKCNLRCKHCYDIFTGNDFLSQDDRNTIINNLLEVNCKRVTLSGGEPLLAREKLFEFAEEFKQRGIKVVLVTNGTLIKSYPKEIYRVFDHIQISLDGPKEIHEQIRGEGTFEKIIESVEYLKDTGVGVSFQITINKINQYSFNDTLNIAKELGIKLSVERVSHTGRATEIEHIDYENYQKILETIVKEKLLSSDPLVNSTICKMYKLPPMDNVVRGCSAGRGGISISCNLDVYPCVRLRINCGNLKTESLKDIISGRVYNDIGNRDKLTGKCGSCQYKYICGGCRADAWTEANDYLAEDSGCLI